MNRITSHLGWKLLSLLLAVAIYSSIRFGSLPARVTTDATPRMTRTLTRPITMMTDATSPGGFEISPSEVEITVRGSEGVIQNLPLSDIKVFVDLVGIEDVVQLKKRLERHVPAGIDLIRLEPEEVTVYRRTNHPVSRASLP
jgi:hypothetical protein